MRRHVQKPQAVRPPWPWDAARYCLELPGGAIRHFPAGTYHAQVATDAGHLELDAMITAYNAWHTFAFAGDMKQWGESELRFVGWLEEEPEPVAVPAWVQADALLWHLWGANG